MTPDQLHQVIVELGGLAAAVFANGKWRKRTTKGQCDFEADAVERLETEGQLMREEMRSLNSSLVRLEVRMETGEKIAEQHRVEMHLLTSRVAAANATYTEILKTKDCEAAKTSQTLIEPGKKPDLLDQTKITIKKGESK